MPAGLRGGGEHLAPVAELDAASPTSTTSASPAGACGDGDVDGEVVARACSGPGSAGAASRAPGQAARIAGAIDAGAALAQRRRAELAQRRSDARRRSASCPAPAAPNGGGRGI